MPFHTTLDAFLQKYQLSSEPRLAVFDCDDTLIRGDVGEAMFYFQIEHFMFRLSPADAWPDHPRRVELQNLYESLLALPYQKRASDRRFQNFAEMMLAWYFDQLADGNTAKACGDITRLLSGYNPSEIRQIADATLVEELAAPLNTERPLGRRTVPCGIRYVRPAVELLQRLHDIGFDVWVVSGSNQWSVEAVCQRLNVPARRIIGIGLVDDDGDLMPEPREPIPVKEGKVRALQERVMYRPLIVVSDSTYDAALFSYSSDLRVLVNWNGHDFFTTTGFMQDESWVVLDNPELQD